MREGGCTVWQVGRSRGRTLRPCDQGRMRAGWIFCAAEQVGADRSCTAVGGDGGGNRVDNWVSGAEREKARVAGRPR